MNDSSFASNNQTIDLSVDEKGICSVTLNRPDVHNAFNEVMIAEITQAMISLESDPNVRIVVVRGAGKSFCAGADINWMRRMADYDEEQNLEDAGLMSEMMDRLYRFPKPTLAHVHGAVFGGGVGLVACCDIAIASEDAVFSLSEVKIGLIPSVISPYVVEAMGTRNARRYFLSGERFGASTARHVGLINECCEDRELSTLRQTILQELLQSAPEAQKIAKMQLQNVVSNNISHEIRRQTSQMIAQVRASDEGREGTAAFLEKRLPPWRSEH
ncbi:MAG: enoyl-CoA hydratase/isomerase family protein [Acidiferrobacterales bacterium]|nr:enoyl-CoA hydratase/isomerase family protein [Acidiferrobacterales bacterium]